MRQTAEAAMWIGSVSTPAVQDGDRINGVRSSKINLEPGTPLVCMTEGRVVTVNGQGGYKLSARVHLEGSALRGSLVKCHVGILRYDKHFKNLDV